MKIKLYDVIDIRNDRYYSVVIVSESKRRFFIEAPVEESEE